jgi:menaquinone-dependent protoporphyrinogen IX oxidase
LPFQPIHLLIAYDDARGLCARVVPRMKEMLEHRAFLVDVHRIQDGAVGIGPYRGVILGTPAFGLGIRGVGPTPALSEFVQRHLADLDEVKAAVFCVYDLRPGDTLDRMKALVQERGAQLVAAHAYPRLRPSRGEHVIPAECMVRIR